jgi:glycosyltransferase involved in cell wall biosynthesis
MESTTFPTLCFKALQRCAGKCLGVCLFPFLAAFFVCTAFIAFLFAKRPIDIGLGPEPLINNLFHKKALEYYGWSAETFVNHVYHITQDFDVTPQGNSVTAASYRQALAALFRYKALYIYFNGGPLAWTALRRIEPFVYRSAGIKILVLPYGSDCQDMTLCPNLSFKHAMNLEYPAQTAGYAKVAENIDRWTKHADHIISGCDWVYYTPRWDTLCLAHFSIDTDALAPPDETFPVNNGPITILHAPNHTELKGTRYFIQAVYELKAEGYPVDLQMVRKIPNVELLELIKKADIIADQLIVGWYAMFAIEGMSAGKPVLCRLRDDLIDLYEYAGLIAPGEIPLVNCTRHTVKEELRRLLDNRELISRIGKVSREYVVKHHSLSAIGGMFDRANRKIGLSPSGEPAGAA